MPRKQLRHAPANRPGFEGVGQLRQRLQPSREGATLGGPPTPARAALERIRPERRKPELVNPVTEPVQRLAYPKAKAAGAAGETVELLIEQPDLPALSAGAPNARSL
jgi:hypothetical protein